MGKRRKSRELALKVLFFMEFIDIEPENAIEIIFNNFEIPEELKEFSEDLVIGVSINKEKIDSYISEASINWRLERMNKVDKNLLRMGVYELLFREDIPPKVTINEAVEIGKQYGTEDSGAFINGVLDSIYNRLKREGLLKKLDSNQD